MGIYDPLSTALNAAAGLRVELSFRQIEEILGRKLPGSAYRHRPWWANEERGHSHAKAWLSAGFETAEVDMTGQRLVFRRVGRRGAAAAGGLSEEAGPFHAAGATAGEVRARRSPLFGALKGTFSVAAEQDLTQPALDAAEQAEWDAGLDRKADRLEEGLRRTS
ncbi:MAG: hypothetical protein IT548_09700 [Alphaproteobacteria bacterium]|nr:hypothetical protein [Alphaproteobacteria bacterium]